MPAREERERLEDLAGQLFISSAIVKRHTSTSTRNWECKTVSKQPTRARNLGLIRR